VEVEYGSLEGLIFKDWQQVDQMPEDLEWVGYGLDFGFTNDPTALVKVGAKGDEIWLDELEYSTGLLASAIVEVMLKNGIGWRDDVVADNKPEAIYELRKAGFNVKAAYKPAGSIGAGIDVLKGKLIRVTKRSVNVIRELRNYMWKLDAQGKPMNVPIDRFNHGIDATRYVVMSKVLKGRRMRIKRS